MGVNGAVFETAGKRTEHFVPGVYSRSYNVTSASGVSSGKLCIIGTSNGGKPLELIELGSVAEAKQTLVGGDLLNAAAYAFNGSNDFIPQKIYALRVNGGKQSELEVKDGENLLYKIKAWDYGVHTNQLRLRIGEGTVEGSTKITLSYKENNATADDILRKSISIASGAENAAVTINEKNLILTADDVETITINFDDFPSLAEVVTKINTTEDFMATLLDSDQAALSGDLDFVENLAINENGVDLCSNYAAIFDALSSIEYVGSIEKGSIRKVPEAMDDTYFTGGDVSQAEMADWLNGLEVLEAEDIQIIATPCSDPLIQTVIANHCTDMSSTVNRKERTCFLGGKLNESDDVGLANARGFNNKLVSYVIDNPIVNNPLTGKTETLDGAMLSVMLAGIESAMSVNVPLTNKTLKVLGFTKKRNITNLEKLIRGGILCCNPRPDDITNHVCIRSVTTYQSADLIANERSMVREDLYMNRDLRKAFGLGIGQPNRSNPASIKATLKMKAKEWADLGYIIPDDSNNNVWNESVKIDGDKIYLTYSRYLTAPTNFIFITATNHVYSSTVEV